jgi:hypothetical protein
MSGCGNCGLTAAVGGCHVLVGSGWAIDASAMVDRLPVLVPDAHLQLMATCGGGAADRDSILR